MAIVTNLDVVNRVVTDIMTDVYGERLSQIILYGSYARGDYNEESDVDYLVVLSEENVSASKELCNYNAALSDYYLNTFIPISAFVVGQNQISYSTKPLYQEVRKDGKTVYDRLSALLHPESRTLPK